MADLNVSIDQTVLPQHLSSMFEQLQTEDEISGSLKTGACLEYLLQHKILETLAALARTDVRYQKLLTSLHNFF